MHFATGITVLIATVHAAPVSHTEATESAVLSTDIVNVLFQLDIPEGGTFALNNHNQVLSFTNDGEVKIPEGPVVEKRQNQVSPKLPEDKQHHAKDDVSGIPPAKGRPIKPDNGVPQKRQIKIPPVLRPFTDEDLDSGNKISAVPHHEKRPTKSNPRHVPPPSHPDVFSTPCNIGNNKINHTSIGKIRTDFERDPASPGPANLRDSGPREGERLVPRGVGGNGGVENDECKPYKYCVDSSGCGGGCDACTYVSWFPYGQCMARGSDVGKVVD